MPRWLEWIPRFDAKTAVAPAAEPVEPRIPRGRPTAVAESAEAAARPNEFPQRPGPEGWEETRPGLPNQQAKAVCCSYAPT